jgi:hypothetical protein
MKRSLKVLQHYEFEALLDALRRDMRTQSELAESGGVWADWHKSNARVCKQILEALNPKAIKSDHAIQSEKSVAHIGSTFIADTQPTKMVQAGACALDRPASCAKISTMSSVLAADLLFAAACPG